MTYNLEFMRLRVVARVAVRRSTPLIEKWWEEVRKAAEWITTSITPTADRELGALFRRFGTTLPRLVLEIREK
jgi:hypothetical protein